MSRKWLKVIVTASTLLCSTQVFAGLDFGDAPESETRTKKDGTVVDVRVLDNQGNVVTDTYDGSYNYGKATHKNPTWQRLGTEWDSEWRHKNKDTDDGVTWSVKQDNGSWSAFSNTEEFEAGDEVQFNFDMTRSIAGDNHYYDQLKAWVDWDQDGQWSEDEELISEIWYKWHDATDEIDATPSTDQNSMLTGLVNDASAYRQSVYTELSTSDISSELANNEIIYNSNDLSRTYSVTTTIPTDAALGDIWLRARVSCSESIYSDGNGNHTLDPTGYYFQGEVEDYLLTINKSEKPPTDIPEPATLGILLSGLGLIAFRQRKQK